MPRWAGKLFVLVLLGFAATDFMITMTLSAADATAHLIQNPLAPGWLQGQSVLVTLVLLALLGAVFLRGFKEAIGVAVVLVGRLPRAERRGRGRRHSLRCSPTPWRWTTGGGDLPRPTATRCMVVGIALLVFPKLALGLSGFETGVAVMPQIQGLHSDTEDNPAGRIQGARRLLTTAAVIMSVFLITHQLHHRGSHPGAGVPARRAGERARAGLPGPRIPRRGLRHRLRHQHHRHPLVRRGLRHGGTAEPGARATCPATAWRRNGPAPSGRWCWCSPRSGS